MKPNPSSSGRPQAGPGENDSSAEALSAAGPRDNQEYEGVKETPTEDALGPGGTEPAYRHPNRPERNKLGGNFHGPGKTKPKRR